MAELHGICRFKGFGGDGFFILPQSLNLGVLGDDGKTDWTAFEKWTLSNEGNASVFFVEKTAVISRVVGSGDEDGDEKEEKQMKFERVCVSMADGYASEKSLFKVFACQKEDVFVTEGFEAMEMDEENRVMFTLEYSKKQGHDADTFNFVVSNVHSAVR